MSIDRTAKSLVDALTPKEKPKPYDTTGTVTRVDGDTLWVHIPGGVEETPVKKTITAAAGDEIQIRVGGGRAWVTGNASAPPTDDTTATEALNQIVQINKMKVGWAQIDEAVVNSLRAKGINADWINTGALTVKDGSDNIIFQADVENGTAEMAAANITGLLTASQIDATTFRSGAANVLTGTAQMMQETTGVTGWENGRWYKSATDTTGTVTFNASISDSPVAGVDHGVKMVSGGSGYIGVAQRAVPIRAGENMVLSAWVKATAGTTVGLSAYWYDGISNQPAKTFTATGNWQNISMSFVFVEPSTTTEVRAGYITFRNAAANNECYVVAPMMEYGDFASSWVPATQDTGISGMTEIDGGNITTGQVNADHINLGGYMTVKQSSLASASVGGYLGYTTVYNNSGVTSGGLQLSTTQSPTQATVDSTVLVTSDYAMIRKVSSSGISSVQANQYGVDIRGDVNIGINRGYSQNSGADLVVDSGFQRIGGIFVEMNGAKALGLLANYIGNGTGLGVIRFYADDSNYIILNYDTLNRLISTTSDNYLSGDADNISVANETYTNVLSFTPTRSGLWQIVCGGHYTTTSSSGFTRLCLGTSSDSYIDRTCAADFAPDTGSTTVGYRQLVVIKTLTAGTTYYFRTYQSTGSAQTFRHAYYRAILLKG